MATITLKNVPEDLHRELKSEAERSGRSLNREIIRRLEEGLRPDSMDIERTLKEVRSVREASNLYLTRADLDEFKREGRV